MEFKKYKLSEIATFSQGKQVDIENQFDSQKDGMVRFVRIVDYTNENEPIRYIENYGARYYVSDQEVAMIRYGSQTAGMAVMGKNGIIANNLFKINVDNSIVENKYLYYFLVQDKVFKYLRGSQSSSTMPAISFNIMNNLEVDVPIKSNQEKIINALDSINNKIKLNSEINNNLHELAEAIFNEYNVNANEDKLDSLIDIVQTGSRPKGGAQSEGIPSIGAEKIEKFGVYDYSTEKYISEDYFEKLKNGIVNSKDVLLYKDGAYTGKSSMALNGFPHSKCAVNEHVFILRTNNLYAQNYLYFTLNNKDVKEKLHMLACGKAAQPGLNQTELKSVDIKLANKDQIIEFENKVSPIMEKIALNSLMNKNLSQLRDTLLPKLMNGEIDLDSIEI